MMQDRILDASIRTVGRRGLGGWTIESVAHLTPCAKGLVIYHYGSKDRLLKATAAALHDGHHARRLVAVSGSAGLAGLDRLWLALEDEVVERLFAAWTAFQTEPGFADSLQQITAEQTVRFADALARCLGVNRSSLGPPDAPAAILDGLQMRLLQGLPAPAAREAYDRLWAGLLAE